MGFFVDMEIVVMIGFIMVVNIFGVGLLGMFWLVFIVGFIIWIMLIVYEVVFGKFEDGFIYIFIKIG